MLKQRLLTAFVLIPLVILATLYLNPPGFAVLIGIIIAAGAWEWAGLAGFRNPAGKAAYVLLCLLLLAICYLSRDEWLFVMTVGVATAWWLSAALLLVFQQRQRQLYLGGSVLKAALGVLVLVPPWLSLVFLHDLQPHGKYLVLYLLALVWLADAAAFGCGQRWGQARLASLISPGKTWAGAYGGVLAGLLAGAAFALATGMQVFDIVIFSIISCITVMGSIVGDLLESLLKRLVNVKDSGNVFPGHGGVMDRIDSLTAAAPLFVAGLWLVRWQA